MNVPITATKSQKSISKRHKMSAIVPIMGESIMRISPAMRIGGTGFTPVIFFLFRFIPLL